MVTGAELSSTGLLHRKIQDWKHLPTGWLAPPEVSDPENLDNNFKNFSQAMLSALQGIIF